jgi:hypothetical protein
VLVDAGPDWIDWTIERETGECRPDGVINESRASLPLGAAGCMEVDRSTTVARLISSPAPSDEAIVHPYLAAMAAIVTRWHRLHAFHCGGLRVHGVAWGVLGGSAAGKSTLLGALASQGIGVISDDLLVIREGMALAGPRCVDLRGDMACALGLGEPIGIVGARERWRVRLEPVPAETPLRGWIVLAWGAEVAVRQVPAAARLPTLLEHATIVPMPVEPAALIDLAAHPMITFERPCAVATLLDSVRHLAGELRDASRQ